MVTGMSHRVKKPHYGSHMRVTLSLWALYYPMKMAITTLRKCYQITLQGLSMMFKATFNNISVISVCSIGGGYRSTWWKPPTCRKSLTNFITYPGKFWCRLILAFFLQKRVVLFWCVKFRPFSFLVCLILAMQEKLVYCCTCLENLWF
jgi:hypothetical protein